MQELTRAALKLIDLLVGPRRLEALETQLAEFDSADTPDLQIRLVAMQEGDILPQRSGKSYASHHHVIAELAREVAEKRRQELLAEYGTPCEPQPYPETGGHAPDGSWHSQKYQWCLDPDGVYGISFESVRLKILQEGAALDNWSGVEPHESGTSSGVSEAAVRAGSAVRPAQHPANGSPQTQITLASPTVPIVTLNDDDRKILLMLHKLEYQGIQSTYAITGSDSVTAIQETISPVPRLLLEAAFEFCEGDSLTVALRSVQTLGLAVLGSRPGGIPEGGWCEYKLSESRKVRLTRNANDYALSFNGEKREYPGLGGWKDLYEEAYSLTGEGLRLVRSLLFSGKAVGDHGTSGDRQACDLLARPLAGESKQPIPTPSGDKPHPATLAKAILFERPDISPTDLAKRVGVKRPTLYKTTGPWKDVRAMLLARGKQDAAPRGSKDADGKLEAEFDPSADRDE